MTVARIASRPHARLFVVPLPAISPRAIPASRQSEPVGANRRHTRRAVGCRGPLWPACSLPASWERRGRWSPSPDDRQRHGRPQVPYDLFAQSLQLPAGRTGLAVPQERRELTGSIEANNGDSLAQLARVDIGNVGQVSGGGQRLRRLAGAAAASTQPAGPRATPYPVRRRFGHGDAGARIRRLSDRETWRFRRLMSANDQGRKRATNELCRQCADNGLFRPIVSSLVQCLLPPNGGSIGRKWCCR